MSERLRHAATTALLGALVACAGACRPASPPAADDDDDTDTTGSTSTGAVSTTFSAPDACEGSGDCEEDSHCVAPYDPGADPPQGAGACIQACIEQGDLTLWCFDDAACCGDLRCNTVDGFCEPRAGADSSGSGSSGSSSGDSESSSSGSDSSGSGSSSGTSDSGTTGGSTTG